jgi:hypothetical protein
VNDDVDDWIEREILHDKPSIITADAAAAGCVMLQTCSHCVGKQSHCGGGDSRSCMRIQVLLKILKSVANAST